MRMSQIKKADDQLYFSPEKLRRLQKDEKNQHREKMLQSDMYSFGILMQEVYNI